MNWNAFRDWAFIALITAGVTVLWSGLGKLENTMNELSKSVQSLNSTMAVITERTVIHEKRLDRHDNEINDLRKKYPH